MILKVARAPRLIPHHDASPTWVVPCILESEHPAFVPMARHIPVPIENELASDITFALLRQEDVLVEVEARRRF